MARERSRKWFRRDIEGIRGMAMLMVLVTHAGVAFAEGGYVALDIFFVISGFLITTLLLMEFDGKGTVSIGKFYARRVRRLLPAAAVTLIAIVVISQILFSPVRNEIIAGDVLAAVGYFVNWRMAAQSVDYFAGGFEASPVQHFWSLAVEEQYYLVWPIFVLGVLSLAVYFHRNRRLVLALSVGALALASLYYSAVFTPESPGQAYFSTLTRIWEILLGCILAIVAIPRVTDRLAAILSWAGLAAIFAAFFIYNETTPYPGLYALLPTLGTAAVIFAGRSSQTSMPMRFLNLEFLQYCGRVSYCWYLWHWPVLIFAAGIFGELSAWGGLAAVTVSWVPAHLTHKLIEQPVLHSRTLAIRPRRAVFVLAAGSGTAALAAVMLVVVQPKVPIAPASEVDGAQVLERNPKVQREARALRPEAAKAFEDRTRLVEDGCFIKLGATEQGECAYGKPESNTTVVLFGDSHAEHYFPAVEHVAKRRGWRLVALTKSFCSPADVELQHPRHEDESFTECEEWREKTIERIVEREKPRLVITSGSRNVRPLEDGEELEGDAAKRKLAAGFERTLRKLRESDAQVAFVTDVPKAPLDIPECVAENPRHLNECTFDRPMSNYKVEEEAAKDVDGAHVIDTQRAVCALGTCRGVIGDAIVYRDRGHLTATFAATLAPLIERQLPRLN